MRAASSVELKNRSQRDGGDGVATGEGSIVVCNKRRFPYLYCIVLCIGK